LFGNNFAVFAARGRGTGMKIDDHRREEVKESRLSEGDLVQKERNETSSCRLHRKYWRGQ